MGGLVGQFFSNGLHVFWRSRAKAINRYWGGSIPQLAAKHSCHKLLRW